MLAGKVKDGTDKLGITVNVELNLHLCFVASCAFEKMTQMYTEGHLISVITMVFQNCFYLFFLPVFTIMLGHYMEQPHGGKKGYLKNIY